MLEVLGFLQVKFCLVVNTDSDTPAPVSTQNQPNIFNILMRNSNKPLLSQHRTVYNNYDQLYNEIIEIFQDQKVGCTGDKIDKKFVIHLTDAFWYINSHLSTLYARTYYLPVQLKMYQDGGSYNKFYYTSHHKKNPML
jgi:hypothetical protein